MRYAKGGKVDPLPLMIILLVRAQGREKKNGAGRDVVCVLCRVLTYEMTYGLARGRQKTVLLLFGITLYVALGRLVWSLSFLL